MEPAIHIHLLGRFGIVIDGVPLRFGRTAPRRPIELLKAVLACGGRGVSADRLADALWPDADGDAGYRALVTTVYRLRQWLGRRDPIVFTGHEVAVDPAWCWVDAWAFERAANGAVDRHDLAAAVGLYRGPFLDHEALTFAVDARERLRRKYVRTVLALAAAQTRGGDSPGAIETLERAADIEPGSAELRAALVGALDRHGERSGAGHDARRRFEALSRAQAMAV
jgi:DNA-binding SARP family transcriptional activator